MKVASPMWILRERAREDLIGTIQSLEGFDGIEFLGLYGNPPREVKKALDGAGLKAASNHVPAGEFLASPEKALDLHEEIGCRNIVLSDMPFSDAAACRKIAGKAYAAARKRGIRLHYHNHAGELEKLPDGRTALDALLEEVPAEEMGFECDAGWISIAGADPAAALARWRDRISILHMKDWEKAPGGYEFRPTGHGCMDWQAMMPQILACPLEWVVADHDDSYGRDPLEELRMSREFIRGLFGA